MKSFSSVLLVTSFASAEVFSLSKGNCDPRSLLDEKQCANLAAEMGLPFGGGTGREGFFFPRGCYLYNGVFDPTRPGNRDLNFAFNTKPKQGPCTKARSCYCDNHHRKGKEKKGEKGEKEFTNELIMLNNGRCDKGTALTQQECFSLSLVSGFAKDNFGGTTCAAPDCAPPGCYLFNGRQEQVVSHASEFNDIGYVFNDYKIGECTDARQCVCHRRDSGSNNYGGNKKERVGYGGVPSYGGGGGYGDVVGGYGDKQSHGGGGGYGDVPSYGGGGGYGDVQSHGGGGGYGDQQSYGGGGGGGGYGDQQSYGGSGGYGGEQSYGGGGYGDVGGGHGYEQPYGGGGGYGDHVTG